MPLPRQLPPLGTPGPQSNSHLHHWSKIVDSLKLQVELSVCVLLLILHFEATVLHITDTL